MPTLTENLIWHYSPSNTRPEQLEALLVEREPILDELMGSVRLAAEGLGVRHFLLVGPRGAGKTHVISVLRHRIDNDPDLRRRVVIGWLPEDMFGMSQPVNWFRILAEEIGKRGEIPEILESLAGLTTPAERTAESVSRLITHYLGDRVLVILHENLNRVLHQLGRRGQQVIRAFLQNNPNILLIATTPSLSEDVQKHEAPFYGFFQTRTLDELTYEGTLDLFIRLARLRGDEETIAYLGTPVGKGRVRAVQLLAGSNPRILIVFGGFMSRAGLESLLPLFEKTIDEMTPYYQERMESLSPQQQEVLLQFLKVGEALTPTDVAERSWLTLKIAGTILANLADLGFLRRRQDGKRTWYDLREPLMKMAWQVKDARTEPIELIVDFVRVWFTPSEVEDRASLLEPDSPVYKTLVKALDLGLKLDLPPMEGASALEAEVNERVADMNAAERVLAYERLIGQKVMSTSEQDLVMLAWAYSSAGKIHNFDWLVEKHPHLISTLLQVVMSIKALSAPHDDPEQFWPVVDSYLELEGDEGNLQFFRVMVQGTKNLEGRQRQLLICKGLLQRIKSDHQRDLLSKALVEAVPMLVDGGVTPLRAECWLNSWREALIGRDAFRIPLRILDAAIKYKAEPNEIHLLQLPQEERAILASLLPENIPPMKGRKPMKRRP